MRYVLTLFVVVLLPLCHSPLFANRSTPYPRDFKQGYSARDKQDIRYIVLTLAANSSLGIAVKGLAEPLNDAGDRIKPVHPLPFLEAIFTDEELKVGIRNIRKSDVIIWRQFMGGLAGSLTEEHRRNNLTPEMVVEFSEKVGVDPKEIQPLVDQERWYDLVNMLILKVPRQGNPGRYDM